jgi:hypothetical protein
MPAPVTRILLTLDGDSGAIVRLLKALLKVLGRAYKVRVRGVRELASSAQQGVDAGEGTP